MDAIWSCYGPDNTPDCGNELLLQALRRRVFLALKRQSQLTTPFTDSDKSLSCLFGFEKISQVGL